MGLRPRFKRGLSQIRSFPFNFFGQEFLFFFCSLTPLCCFTVLSIAVTSRLMLVLIVHHRPHSHTEDHAPSPTRFILLLTHPFNQPSQAMPHCRSVTQDPSPIFLHSSTEEAPSVSNSSTKPFC
ncbi:hypothetical protein CFP56_043148 [Quercus suber]|uniref:Uncharacterized protein n=1 Tax=Quercus suber TaxID=58331 RepID=A0AAW0LHV5_QUESU